MYALSETEVVSGPFVYRLIYGERFSVSGSVCLFSSNIVALTTFHLVKNCIKTSFILASFLIY